MKVQSIYFRKRAILEDKLTQLGPIQNPLPYTSEVETHLHLLQKKSVVVPECQREHYQQILEQIKTWRSQHLETLEMSSPEMTSAEIISLQDSLSKFTK